MASFRGMTDEFFFITFGGLGVSLAGFAGLIHALDRSEDADDPITKWRIRSIVLAGFSVALSGLVVWPLFRLTEDVTLTVRLASAVLFLMYLQMSVRTLRPGPEWPDHNLWRINLALASLTLAATLVNALIASVGFLELLFVVAVAQPMGTFIRAIHDLHRVNAEADASSG